MKFMYNGIKLNGKLYKAYISLGIDWNNEEAITIYKRSYESFPEEIKNAFTVKNDSDGREDYFETDRFTLKSNHPLFKEALQAWVQDQEKSIIRIQNRMNKASTKKYLLDGYQNDISWKQKQLARVRKEYL